MNTIGQLHLVEMVAQGNAIPITLCPHDLQLRVKFPESLSADARQQVIEAVDTFQKFHATIELPVTRRGSITLVDNGIVIRVKTIPKFKVARK
jgi:hypothetical protein